MYDENAYRQTYSEINPLKCVFERGMLRQCMGCESAIRRNIAEREAVGCRDHQAHALCTGFKERLRRAATFVLKVAHPDDPLPHVKELKLQCGGILGLATAEAEGPGAENVAGLLRAAVARHGGLDDLPYQALLPAIRTFEARPRR